MTDMEKLQKMQKAMEDYTQLYTDLAGPEGVFVTVGKNMKAAMGAGDSQAFYEARQEAYDKLVEIADQIRPTKKNEMVLEGRLVEKPELKHIGANNTPLVETAMAFSLYKGKDEGGNPVFDSEFLKIKVWDEAAKRIADMGKGDTVRLNGRIRARTYEYEKEGVTIKGKDIHLEVKKADDITLVKKAEPKQDKNRGVSGNTPVGSAPGGGLPF